MIPPSRSPEHPIIHFEDVHFAYPDPDGEKPHGWTLQGLDLSIHAGEIVAIMGPTGAGKSTLALAMLGVVPQSTGGWIRGSITVCGRDPVHSPIAEMAQSVGLVFQDPEDQFLTNSVDEEIAFGLESLSVPTAQMPAKIAHALKQIGIQDLVGRSPHQLSGGQKQRVAIASILAMEPQVLVLDEASASLDPFGASELLGIIRQLRDQSETTIVMMTNKADWIQDLADRVMILAQGRIQQQGTPEQIFRQVEELMALGLAPPQLEMLRHLLRERTGRSYQFESWPEAEQELRGLLEMASP